jgi:hypothetical protein
MHGLTPRRRNPVSVHRTIRAFFTISLALSVSGCGLFSDPKAHPVIENHVNAGRGPVSTLATTPERRVVLVNTIDEDASNGSKPHKHFGHFCAEPPADVAESLSATLQAALTAAVQSPTRTSFEGGGEFGKTLATAVQALTQRSQGITLFRDGSYNLCAMFLNDFINQEQYLVRWDALLATSRDLALFELYKNEGKIGSGTPSSLSAPDLQKLEALLDDYWANRGSIFAKPATDKATQQPPADSVTKTTAGKS